MADNLAQRGDDMIFHGPCTLTSEAGKNRISSLTNAIRVIMHAKICGGRHAQPPPLLHIHEPNISTFICFKRLSSLWHLYGFDKASVLI